MLKNQSVRNAAKQKRVCLWELADKLGVSEPTVTRKLRHELPAQEQQQLLGLIEEIAWEKEKAAD